MKKRTIGFLILGLAALQGCILNNDSDNSSTTNQDTSTQIVVQTKINGFVSECRNYAKCDTSEASAIYYISLEDGRFFEISRATYFACRDGGNGLYPACVPVVKK